MADFAVKLEAEPSQDNPLFVSDDEDHAPRSPSPFVTTSLRHSVSPSPVPSYSGEIPNHDTPTWQTCSNLDMLAQIEIKEDAVRNGINGLKNIEAALRQHAGEVWSSSKWLERIETIRAAKKECRVLIGFLGVTGAGKSTLINSVLGYEDLLPADDERACTAVICEISWNYRTDPAAAFVAIIDHINEQDWEFELRRLYRDIADKVSNKDGDGEELDLERDERIRSAFGKVNNVQNILDQSKTIKADNILGFADAIKPYIDSNNSKEEGSTSAFAQWPLVKLVRLQIKAEVLQTGIVLVDLPGSMDTNAARGAVAATYTKNLTVSCVVSPISRAASDKPAQDLLGSITKRYLQLEDHFTSDHLCFIVTKIDTSLSVNRYIKTHPEVGKGLEKVYDKEARTQESLAYMQLQDEMRQLEAFIKNDKSKRKRDTDESPTSSAQALGYKRNKINYLHIQKQALDTQNAINAEESWLGRANQKMNELKDAEWCNDSKKMHACIQSRNAVSTTALRDDFETVRRQMGEKKATKPLQVFCISPVAYFSLQTGQRPQGFFRKSDTGIPALRKWLVDATLGNRSRNADSFLADIESLETTLRLWAADTKFEYKLPVAKKDEIENAFDEEVDILCKKLQDLNKRTADQIEKHFENGIFKHMPLTEKKGVEKGEVVVRSWAQQPMVWGTHRACNRNNGDWKSHKGTMHHWNDDLAGLYFDDYMIKNWRKSVHQALPEYHQKYKSSVGVILGNFVDSVVTQATAICPQVAEPLGLWKQSVIKGAKPLEDNAEEIFENKIKVTARKAHQLIVPKIRETWLPIYVQCGDASGKGHFKRNIETHVDFIQKHGRRMYKKCSKEVRGAFQTLGKTLPVEFSQSTDTATARIEEEFSMMMENHTIKDATSAGGQGGVCPSKVKLHDALKLIFADLHAAWGAEIAEPVEEEEEEPEDEEIDISEFKAEEGLDEADFVISDISDNDDAKDADYIPGV
ncbi:hypothetical protein DSL72_009476 [Monilinia vaccinii-corymbosi]|uniref:Dynamin N-terminal domain-containing protein n=1 Tax=Monilinia vaccinii-corymbosi TaxID=61207 RepID=A0A8A3PPK9_9HELO|nr:hypothetical protein DSL72_009476 [Monilinia vaccinii-corymbosi]